MAAMKEPRVITRAEHTISRRDIDPEALKVLYRLRQFDHIAYLVGGSVRDLLLSRRPKDFDIGTSAHPYQVKKLFRNCWIIGRRFRLAHVKFGPKVIEVATFRRQVQPGEEVAPAAPVHDSAAHHDNTFGTPEEDAFRRDFTINALFYDIATFSIIDYVNGMDDLHAGVVRSIGDPEVRFKEDPVRMLRAVALAARLNFRIDPPVVDAIRLHRHEIARSSPARLLEECSRSSAVVTRSGSFEGSRRLACWSRSPQSFTGRPARPSGSPSRRWTAIVRDSRASPRRSPTLCSSEASSCLAASRPGTHGATMRPTESERGPRGPGWASSRSRGGTWSGSARSCSCSGVFASWVRIPACRTR
jgi:hypothetical protein